MLTKHIILIINLLKKNGGDRGQTRGTPLDIYNIYIMPVNNRDLWGFKLFYFVFALKNGVFVVQ